MNRNVFIGSPTSLQAQQTGGRRIHPAVVLQVLGASTTSCALALAPNQEESNDELASLPQA